jgi:hypothetical protein
VRSIDVRAFVRLSALFLLSFAASAIEATDVEIPDSVPLLEIPNGSRIILNHDAYSFAVEGNAIGFTFKDGALTERTFYLKTRIDSKIRVLPHTPKPVTVRIGECHWVDDPKEYGKDLPPAKEGQDGKEVRVPSGHLFTVRKTGILSDGWADGYANERSLDVVFVSNSVSLRTAPYLSCLVPSKGSKPTIGDLKKVTDGTFKVLYPEGWKSASPRPSPKG